MITGLAATANNIVVQNSFKGLHEGILVNGQSGATMWKDEWWTRKNRQDTVTVAPSMAIFLVFGVNWISMDKAKQDTKTKDASSL
jgi:hypothetical protein